MLIDWFTVIAQIVNFLILVALLKHFLWGRLVRVIDDREQRVATQVAEAEKKNKTAEQKLEQIEARERQEQTNREALLLQAQKAADQRKAELVNEARAAVEKTEAQWRDAVKQEKKAFVAQMKRESAKEILEVARQAVADLASTDLEQAAFETFLGKLNSFDGARLRDFAKDGLVVRSAAELSEDNKKHIQTAVGKKLDQNQALRFEVDRSLEWGLELCGNGQKLGWSSTDYLDRLEQNLSRTLEHAVDTPLETVPL